MPSSEWIPMRWPAGWAGAGLLDLLKGTPVNCLVAGQHAARLREAANRLGIAVFEAPPPEITVLDGVWPGMRISQERRRRDEAESGPTGAPWIDSNCSSLRLARARSPKPVWVAFDPAKDAG
ncbi:MAG: hypothetical protein HY822_22955 [Acidobacteria bacterium]|nr:hypothetical protein [Acidobacteriota bacterium]